MDEWAYGVTLSSGGGLCSLFSYIHKRQTQRQQSLYHTCFLGGCCEGSAQEATQPPTSRSLPAPKRPNRCTEGPKRHQLPVLSRRGHVDRQCSRSSSSQAVPESPKMHEMCTLSTVGAPKMHQIWQGARSADLRDTFSPRDDARAKCWVAAHSMQTSKSC